MKSKKIYVNTGSRSMCVHTQTHIHMQIIILLTHGRYDVDERRTIRNEKSKRRRRRRKRSDKAWQIQFETATLSCWQNAAMSRALPQCEIYLLCCCHCVSYHSPFVLLCAACCLDCDCGFGLSFICREGNFTTVAFILLLWILILLKARAVASLQN